MSVPTVRFEKYINEWSTSHEMKAFYGTSTTDEPKSCSKERSLDDAITNSDYNEVSLIKRSRSSEHFFNRVSILTPTGGELHAVCIDRTISWSKKLDELRKILKKDPAAVERPLTLHTKPLQIYRYNNSENQTTLQPETSTDDTVAQCFQYPINLALSNANTIAVQDNDNEATEEQKEEERSCKIEFLTRLIVEGPGVLSMLDGLAGKATSSVHLVLRYLPFNECNEIIDSMILNNPRCIYAVDSMLNTPLHTCVRYSYTKDKQQSLSALERVQRIYMHDPTALRKQNKNNLTPTSLAATLSICPEAIAEFLYESQTS